MPRLLLALTLWLVTAAAFAADTLVLCPPGWRAELRPWIDLRKSQGRTVTVLDAAATVTENRRLVRQANTDGELRFVVLVGDVATPGAPPCGYEPLEIIRRWGPEPTAATDHVYADLTGDAAPELAVGRLPCRTAGELRGYLQRIVSYETRERSEAQNNELTVVASPGNFSPWLDRVLEAVATRVLTEVTPPNVKLNAIYASPSSPRFPTEIGLHAAVLESYRRPALAWVYLGHGLPYQIDSAPTDRGRVPLLDTSTAHIASQGESPPIACLLTCYTGAFDARQPCLAEAMLARPGGPLAVIAASRVTMPYGNGRLGLPLLEQLFGADSSTNDNSTVGQMLRRSKAALLADASDVGVVRSLEQIASGLTPEPDRVRERTEHAYAYNLLGDPLLSRPRASADTKKPGREKSRDPARVAGELPTRRSR